MKRLAAFLWTAPLLLQTADAYAWGLYTHMYFAQLLVWTLPFADPRLRRTLTRFPELCFAGTRLPDVASRPCSGAAARSRPGGALVAVRQVDARVMLCA